MTRPMYWGGSLSIELGSGCDDYSLFYCHLK
jgi:hypothetical protein